MDWQFCCFLNWVIAKGGYFDELNTIICALIRFLCHGSVLEKEGVESGFPTGFEFGLLEIIRVRNHVVG